MTAVLGAPVSFVKVWIVVPVLEAFAIVRVVTPLAAAADMTPPEIVIVLLSG
jgi:hypothetical protein